VRSGIPHWTIEVLVVKGVLLEVTRRYNSSLREFESFTVRVKTPETVRCGRKLQTKSR